MRGSEYIEHKPKEGEDESKRIVAAIGYPIWIVALVLAIVEKKDRFVRHHALQALFFWISVFVLAVGLTIIQFIFSIIPIIGWVIGWIIYMVIVLGVFGAFVLSILYAIRVSKGEVFEIPLVTSIMRSIVKEHIKL